MSYNIYKNKKLLKELSDKDYRLLKFNKILNPFHTYLMYSLIPSELNELNLKDLNSVVEIFKKDINKFVKKKYNKNYVNANAQKDLDIFAELCHLNISIFNNNFNNLHSTTKNKKYTKRLYFLNRDNDLFLLIKNNKKGLKLKLGNNVLKPIQDGGGGPVRPSKGRKERIKDAAAIDYKNDINQLEKEFQEEEEKLKTNLKIILEKFKKKPSEEEYLVHPFMDNYYDLNKVNEFLTTYCEKLIIKEKQTDALTKLIDSIIYPQNIIKSERFKDFKRLSITDKKKNEEFKRHDDLLRDLKTKKKNKETLPSIILINPGELLTVEEIPMLNEDWLNEVYKEDNDIIDTLEILKETKGKLNKEKLEHFKEIIIALFTDNMRDQILLSIKKIEAYINRKLGEDMPVRIIISGGSGFNNLVDKDVRPISPDIDVKLCLHSQDAINLHEYMTNRKFVENIGYIQMEVAKQLLIVRTHLFDVMKDEAVRLKNLIRLHVEKFNNMFDNLYKYCSFQLMDRQNIPFLNTLNPDDKEIDDKWKRKFKVETVKVLVRETLMKRGIDGEPNNPYKLHDVFLYSLDLPFDEKTGFDSLAGILDIVVSIPGHIGYILPTQYKNENNLQEDIKPNYYYNITIDYYTEELNKLLKYGLRTNNGKILKDLVRYRILLISQNKQANDDIKKTVEKILSGIPDRQEYIEFKKEISERLAGLTTLQQEPLLQSQELIFDSQDSYEYLSNSDNHLINLDEHCSQEDEISESSEDSDFDNKMSNMNKDYAEYINEHGSLNEFVSACAYHGMCGFGGGNKKKKQIGGTPCDYVEMLSLSKVFQLMVNNKSMEGFDSSKLSNIKLVPDKNEVEFEDYNVQIPTINFEKLTEIKAKHPNNVKSKSNDWTNEYLSTKASSRVSSFRMSKNKISIITNICNHLIQVIIDGNINQLCYCYESEFYKPGNQNVPTHQQYAQFLLTQCQVLEKYDSTKGLYYAIKAIAKGSNLEDIRRFLIIQSPSRVIPHKKPKPQ